MLVYDHCFLEQKLFNYITVISELFLVLSLYNSPIIVFFLIFPFFFFHIVCNIIIS